MITTMMITIMSMNMNTIMTTMTTIMNMNTIMTMTSITMITIMTSIATTTMITSIITTMMIIVAADMTITTITQMKSSQAGAKRHLASIQRKKALSADNNEYGIILRAKGMLPSQDGTWIYFDMVPEEYEIREGQPEYTGRLCVIGSKIDEAKLEKLFML